MAATTGELLAAHSRLCEEIRSHKAAIQHHRRQLHAAAAERAELEAEFRRQGVRLILIESDEGRAASHGREQVDTASQPANDRGPSDRDY